MTHEQLVYWLEGYLAASTIPHDHKVAISAKIDETRAKTAVHVTNGLGGISIRPGDLARGGFVPGPGGAMPFGAGGANIALCSVTADAVGKPMVSVNA